MQADIIPKKIVLFASGSGSNVERIAQYFSKNPKVVVSAVFCNNPKAGVIERCKRLELTLILFNRESFYKQDYILMLLRNMAPDLIVLAGFLWKIPEAMVRAFAGKMINVHPALLPAYGGKGMYGARVHNAVIANKEPISGITIHYVNEFYDQGSILEQHQVKVVPEDTPESLAKKIHALEYTHFPILIENLLKA
jgi:phosphoribosylglycinamide formyltransferase-1